MIGVWFDEFGRTRKYLSASIYDKRNNVSQSFVPIKRDDSCESRKVNQWNLYMNPMLGYIYAPYIPLYIFQNTGGLIANSLIAPRPMPEPTNTMFHMNIVRDD